MSFYLLPILQLECGAVLFVILEKIVNLGRKVRNRRLIKSDDFFKDHCFLRTKNALPGMISGQI